jgi:hypothetical protein
VIFYFITNIPEYNASWKQANLDYATAQGIRRYTDNNNLVVIAVDPNRSRIVHTATPEARGAKAPKPMDLSAKTSDNPKAPASVYGLVAKPSRVPPNGPTQSDYKAAVKKWHEDIKTAYKKGYMVRPIEGLLLTDVWDNKQTKQLTYRPTKTAEGSRFVVFPEVIVCASLSGT